MKNIAVLKAIADDTRMSILTLLLKKNYCVRALARNLGLSEATISQHLKTLREAGLLTGEKHGSFMHYDVERKVLKNLAGEIDALAIITRKPCKQDEEENCPAAGKQNFCNKKVCGKLVKHFCHGTELKKDGKHGNCKCDKS